MKRLEVQPAPVHGGSQRAPEGQAIRSGLFLNDAELRCALGLPLGKILQQFRPFDASFRLDGLAPWIKSDCAVQVPGVQQNHSGAELLPAHGMAATRDANGQTFPACLKDRFSEPLQRPRAHDACDARAVPLGVMSLTSAQSSPALPPRTEARASPP